MLRVGKAAALLLALASASLHTPEFPLVGTYECRDFQDFHVTLELRIDGTAEREVVWSTGIAGDWYAGTWERQGGEVRVTWTDERERQVPAPARIQYRYEVRRRNLVMNAFIVAGSTSELGRGARIFTKAAPGS